MHDDYPGATVTFGGEHEYTQRSFESLGYAFIIAVLVMYVILATQFQSYLQPLIILSAIVCALFGVPCVIYMGRHDMERQQPNVKRMELLGARVQPVDTGSATLKDAMNEALRDWITHVEDTYYLLGTGAGPHPYPQMVCDFQQVIGREAREQFLRLTGALPDALVACVGGGSNAAGLFIPFLAATGWDQPRHHRGTYRHGWRDDDAIRPPILFLGPTRPLPSPRHRLFLIDGSGASGLSEHLGCVSDRLPGRLSNNHRVLVNTGSYPFAFSSLTSPARTSSSASPSSPGTNHSASSEAACSTHLFYSNAAGRTVKPGVAHKPENLDPPQRHEFKVPLCLTIRSRSLTTTPRTDRLPIGALNNGYFQHRRFLTFNPTDRFVHT